MKNFILIDDKIMYLDQGKINNRGKFSINAIFCLNLQEEIKNEEELYKQTGFCNLKLSQIQEFKNRLEKIV